jgi:hypothetical protein
LYWQASLGGDANLYVYPNSNIGARLSASVHSIYLLNFSIVCARCAARGPEKKGHLCKPDEHIRPEGRNLRDLQDDYGILESSCKSCHLIPINTGRG